MRQNSQMAAARGIIQRFLYGYALWSMTIEIDMHQHSHDAAAHHPCPHRFFPKNPHMPQSHMPQLTVEILTHLDVGDVAGATARVEASHNGVELIELLDLLWNTNTPHSKALLSPVLQRLEHLRPALDK